MNFVVTIDWKFVVALGATITGTVFASKMDAGMIERVSISMVDALKGYSTVNKGCH